MSADISTDLCIELCNIAWMKLAFIAHDALLLPILMPVCCVDVLLDDKHESNTYQVLDDTQHI